MPERFPWRRVFAHTRRILGFAAGLALFAYLASGLYAIKPEETGVVKRFGAVVADDVPSGIHLHLPWPIETVARVNTKEVRSLKVTFDQSPASLNSSNGGALLTGDENLVILTLLAQYTVQFPAEFLHVTSDPETMLSTQLEAACVRLIASMTVEDMLTTGRGHVQQILRDEVQKRVDKLHLGVHVVSVQIQRIEPPSAVAEAFKDVASAHEDAQKLIQTASGEYNSRLPRARAEAERMRSEAEAKSQESVEMAKGDAERFLDTWAAYQKSKNVTALRLYMETMENVLPKVRKQLVNPKAERRATIP